MSRLMFKQREGALCRIFAPRSRTHLLGPRDTSLPSERGSGPRRGYPEGGGRTGLPKVLGGAFVRRVPGVIGVRNEIAVRAAQEFSQPTVPAQSRTMPIIFD